MTTLRDPLTIRSVSLPNRLWFPPVARDLAGIDGLVTDQHVQGYRAVASGGVGTVVVEHCFVHPDGRYSERQLGIDHDGCVPGLHRLAEAIRAQGAVPVVQVSFAGSRTRAGRKLGPSAIPLPGDTEPAQEIPLELIKGLPGLYVEAARRARDAGFCGVELHGAHGFLLSEFLSPLCNQRTDAYGGTLQNRARLSIEVVRAVRAIASDAFFVGFRLAGTDGMDGGLTVSESESVAVWLQEAGVDLLSISGGLLGSRPQGKQAQGYFFAEAEAIRKRVSIPVVGVGGVTDPQVARDAIAAGRFDLVGVARKLFQDPQWARRALQG